MQSLSGVPVYAFARKKQDAQVVLGFSYSCFCRRNKMGCRRFKILRNLSSGLAKEPEIIPRANMVLVGGEAIPLQCARKISLVMQLKAKRVLSLCITFVGAALEELNPAATGCFHWV